MSFNKIYGAKYMVQFNVLHELLIPSNKTMPEILKHKTNAIGLGVVKTVPSSGSGVLQTVTFLCCHSTFL